MCDILPVVSEDFVVESATQERMEDYNKSTHTQTVVGKLFMSGGCSFLIQAKHHD